MLSFTGRVTRVSPLYCPLLLTDNRQTSDSLLLYLLNNADAGHRRSG